MLQIKLHKIRALLPENDFGKMIAKNNYLVTGIEQNFSEWDISHDGMMQILEALFGKASFKKVSNIIFLEKNVL